MPVVDYKVYKEKYGSAYRPTPSLKSTEPSSKDLKK